MFVKLLKEPLLHFLVLGALIFVVYGWKQGSVFSEQIVISADLQQNMAAVFERTWRRQPTETELDALIQDRIREELAYRESREMGLDEDDIIVRRRLRQKLELLAEDVATLTPPEEEVLKVWYAEHSQDYVIPAKYSFQQIYIKPQVSGEATRLRATSSLIQLNEDPSFDWLSLGDPIMLPATVTDATAAVVESSFGTSFTDTLVNAETGVWAGPYVSGFGIHIVRVTDRKDERLAAFDDVREQVERDWLAAKKQQALDDMYEQFAASYEIVIEPQKNQVPE